MCQEPKGSAPFPGLWERDNGDKWWAVGMRQGKKVPEGLCVWHWPRHLCSCSNTFFSFRVFFKAKDAEKLGEGGRHHQGSNLGTCKNPTQSLAPVIEMSSCVSGAQRGPDSSLGNCMGFKAKSVYQFFTQFILPATFKCHPRLQSASSLLTPKRARASAQMSGLIPSILIKRLSSLTSLTSESPRNT